MLANHKMAYIEGGTNQNKLHICICKHEFLTVIFVKITDCHCWKIYFSTYPFIYFEEIATYNIVIKKYQSAMLIQVINYKDKSANASSSKS